MIFGIGTDIVEVERLNTLGSIGITSQGRNYLVSPDLVIQDGYTKQVLNDVDLEYALLMRNFNNGQNTRKQNLS